MHPSTAKSEEQLCHAVMRLLPSRSRSSQQSDLKRENARDMREAVFGSAGVNAYRDLLLWLRLVVRPRYSRSGGTYSAIQVALAKRWLCSTTSRRQLDIARANGQSKDLELRTLDAGLSSARAPSHHDGLGPSDTPKTVFRYPVDHQSSRSSAATLSFVLAINVKPVHSAHVESGITDVYDLRTR